MKCIKILGVISAVAFAAALLAADKPAQCDNSNSKVLRYRIGENGTGARPVERGGERGPY